MGNAAADRFVQNLIAISCRKFRPDQSQIELYKSKLRKWYMREEEWAAAMSRIAAEYADEGLPPLSMIYGYLKASEFEKQNAGAACLLFRIDGFCYVLAEKNTGGSGLHVKAIDPAHPPLLPPEAEDVHYVIPPELQYRGEERNYSREIKEIVGSIEKKEKHSSLSLY